MQLTKKSLYPLPLVKLFEINICQEGIYYFHMLVGLCGVYTKLTFCTNEQFISVVFCIFISPSDCSEIPAQYLLFILLCAPYDLS